MLINRTATRVERTGTSEILPKLLASEFDNASKKGCGRRVDQKKILITTTRPWRLSPWKTAVAASQAGVETGLFAHTAKARPFALVE